MVQIEKGIFDQVVRSFMWLLLTKNLGLASVGSSQQVGLLPGVGCTNESAVAVENHNRESYGVGVS